jgi:hypothetical protein
MRYRWLSIPVVAAAGAAAAILISRRRARRAMAAADPVEYAGEMAMDVGIAPVDPEPMTQVTGEGIDPDMDVQLPEELRAILSPGFANRARIP